MKFFKILKKHKLFISLSLTCILVLYLLFLFAVPNLINLNNYKKDIQKIVYDTAKLNLDFSDMKIVTTPCLKAGINAKGVVLSYPEGEKIASLKEAEVKIALLPLILKTLKVSDVSVNSPELNFVILKNGQIDIVDYINKNMPLQQESPDTAAQELPVKISSKLPVVTIKDYSFVMVDEKTNYSLALKGENFIFDNAVLNKHFRVSSNGKFLINNEENINYNARVKMFWPAVSQSEPQQTGEMPQIDFISELVKYSPKADINADITLKEHNAHTDINGYANLDKVSLKLNNKRLPESFVHLTASGHDTKLESDLYISPSEKAQLLADLSHGHKTKIDLKVKTDKITFLSIKNFAQALFASFDIKNDIDLINVQGYIQSDFSLKTDLKDFESSGYFKLSDGVITHKTIPVSIKSLCADIDFANNSLNITKAGANINGAQINAEGKIDASSNTDIAVKSDDINIAPLFNAFAPADLKNMYLLNSGILNINFDAKGKLDDIQLSLAAKIRNFLLKSKSPLPVMSLSAKDMTVEVDPENIKIVPFDILFNSSKIHISGSVENYLKNMKINISADGDILANDLKNLLPKETRYFVGASGKIPVSALIRGNDKKITVEAQAYTNSSNHFSPLTVKKMIGKSGLVNFSAVYSNDKLNIEDASLYQSPKNSFGKDFSANKKGALKIAGLNGHVSDVSTGHPSLKISFSIPELLVLSSSVMPDAQIKMRGDLSLFGDMNNPSFNGFFSVKDVSLPDFLVKIQAADIELNDNLITAKIQNFNINNTPLNIDAVASSKFTNIFLIKSLILTSTNFDADNIFAAMDKINTKMAAAGSSGSTASSNSLVLPVKISDGDLNLQKFKMKQAGGNLEATDVTGDFTLVNDLFKLNNLKASVFDGNISGDVTYNLKNTAVTAKVTGSKINANPAVTVFVGLKDQLIGNIDFDADVTLKGQTYEQQMKTLNGKVHFEMKDGQMGSLGRFETFLKADNLLSQSFVSTKIGSLVSAVAPYNTGKFSYLNGDINLKNGTASLSSVKMSGPHMALILTGNVNVLSMISSLEILGSLSPEVTAALGPVAELSVEKFASFIPKFGAKIASALNTYNAAANKSVLAKIPALTPAKDNTKSFKVVLNGNLNTPAGAIDRFQWLNTPEKIQQEQEALQEAVEPQTPATKEEIKEQIKEDIKQGVSNAIQQNEKVQELKQNKAVKTLSDIYNFYKNSKTKTPTQTESSQSDTQTQTTGTTQTNE